MLIALVLALSVILCLLGAVLKSLTHAILVFAVVPLAMSGGVLGLFLRGMHFNRSAGLGFVALAGLATWSGHAMVSRIERFQGRDMPLRDAVFSGARAQLRPVLIISLAVGLGLFPMALSAGKDAEIERGLATVVIGGLVSSLPVMLLLLHSI